MTTDYILSLDKGVITMTDGPIVGGVRGHMYQGSTAAGSWSPYNPKNNPDAMGGPGFKHGDTLTVHADFNFDPENISLADRPPATQYVGLSVGACHAENHDKVEELRRIAHSLPLQNSGHLLGGIFPSNKDAEHEYEVGVFGQTQEEFDGHPNNYIFVTATASRYPTLPLTPAARGSIPEKTVYQWRMVFNENNIIDSTGQHIELVFGYGDPMFEEETDI